MRNRACLDAVLDTLIPPNTERAIPGAGEANVAEFIEQHVAADATLCKLFDDGFAYLGDMSADRFELLPEELQITYLQGLEKSKPDFFAELIRLTYMGYYSRPEIRRLLGLSGKPVHPAGYDVALEPPELLSELTAPVRARGEVYRDV